MPRRVVPIWRFPDGPRRPDRAAGVDAPQAQRVELVDQHARIDDDAVTDDAALARVEDARRDEVELVLARVSNDRVPGVVAALEAHNGVRPLGKQVGYLALALIAPLGADDHDSRHRPILEAAAGLQTRALPGGGL